MEWVLQHIKLPILLATATALMVLLSTRIPDLQFNLSIASFNTTNSSQTHPTTSQQPTFKPVPGTVEKINSWLVHDHDIPDDLFPEFLITPDVTCPPGKPPHYVITVKSATSHFSRRAAIRQTYAQRDLFPQLEVRLIFLLGRAARSDHVMQIQSEAAQFKDILQGDFTDTYRNLTIKGVMGLRWLAEFCPGMGVVIKLDDDVFVNMYQLVSGIGLDFSQKSRSLGCLVWPNGTNRIQRTYGWSWGKWELERSEFKGEKYYPFPSCNGFFVMVSGDLVAPLVSAARVTRFFWIDDLYLYGLLPLVVGGVKHRDVVSRAYTWNLTEAEQCFRESGAQCKKMVVVNGELGPGHLRDFWSLISSDRNVTVG